MPKERSPIRTPRVEAAERELLEALREAIPSSGIERDRAAGLISSLMCDLYNAAEDLAKLARLSRQSWR